MSWNSFGKLQYRKDVAHNLVPYRKEFRLAGILGSELRGKPVVSFGS